MIRDLIMKNRSYRRFDSSVKIEEKQLRSWIELARFSASGRDHLQNVIKQKRMAKTILSF